MATTSIHPIRVTEAKSIKYIMNPDKAAYVTRYGCWGNAVKISDEFSKLRGMGRNIGSVLSYHIIQSFAPNEATAEQVHQAGLMLCDKLLQGKYEPTHKYKIKFRLEGQQRFVRGETLGEYYTADAIAEQIELIYKTAEENMRKANAEPAPTVTAPKIEPIAEPKPTITAVPKTEPKAAPFERGGVVYNALLNAMRKRGIEPIPTTAAEPDDRTVTTAEEFLSGTSPQDEPIATAEPIEKPSEKKEIEVDPWEGLRNYIGKCDSIIAELKEIGFTSYKDLSYFLSIGVHEKHPQDHGDEIEYKKSRIKRVETLIDSIQRRDRLKPIKAESDGKSGWSKSRYDKKHHDELYDYDTAVSYIKKHLDEFKTKEGNTSTLKDLQDRLKRMKKKLKELEDENAIFLSKSRGVRPYITRIRSIHMSNINKRQRERSDQKLHSQQRKKNTYLE